ncbi:MAG TPA: Spo0B domain-containing protein [Calditerricola sp.]|jgi:hypothetical protein
MGGWVAPLFLFWTALCLVMLPFMADLSSFGLAASGLAALVGYTWVSRRQWRMGEAEVDRTWLEVLNRTRHDWLNHLQVLSGYGKLHQYGKMERYIQRIMEQAACESRLCHLGYPPLTRYLLACAAERGNMVVDVSVSADFSLERLPLSADDVYRVVQAVVETYRDAATGDGAVPNTLTLILENGDGRLHVRTRFAGRLDEVAFRKGLQRLARLLRTLDGVLVDGTGEKEAERGKVRVSLVS